MKKKILIIFFSFFNIINAYAYNEFKIQNIHFVGLQNIPEGEVLLNIPVRIGDIINKENIANTIHMLFSTKYFENIYISYKKNTLFIYVKEKPIITNIFFFGNEKIKQDTLKKIFHIYNLKSGKFLDKKLIFYVKKHVENLYLSIGKYNTIITPIIIPISNNHVYIKLKIKEGEYTKIKSFRLIGNKSFNNKELTKKIQINENFLNWKEKKLKIYQQKKLINYLKLLQNFYLSRGYANFKINSTNIQLTKNKKYAYIKINISEGKKYKISKINLQGDIISHYKYKKINKLIQTILIKPYDLTQLTNIKNKIKKLLSSYGYIYPNIIIQMKENNDNNTIDLHIYIDPNTQFYVQKIFFEGNNTIKDNIIRREINQIEGTYINMELINQGKKKLINLEYFENINVKIQHIPNSLNKINILYKMKEKNTGSFNAGIGFNQENKLNFQFNVKKNNWLKIGNSISLESNKSNNQFYNKFSIISPYYTNNKINFSNNILYKNFNIHKIINKSNYNLLQYGTNIICNIPVKNYKSLFNIKLEYIHNSVNNITSHISEYHSINSKINQKKIANKKINNINLSAEDIFLNLHWNFNNINKNIFPTTGSNTDLMGKITLPISHNNYYKIIFKSNYFIPIIKNINWIFFGKTYFGYSNSKNRQKIPFYDHFCLKEFNKIRGFYLENIVPTNKCNKYNKNKFKNLKYNTKKPIFGGDSIFIINNEITIPITSLIKKKYQNLIRTSLFIDIGTIWNNNWKKNKKYLKNTFYNEKFQNIRISSGINFQLISPLGPLIFSYGYPIKFCKGDKIEKFQFNVGKSW
ncbi:MAG: outer membrane protein assembly factor BamA [Candidatus Westeberhardia cardiocondylae]|nr:outer membrane protein assembly factor BamA [Candidatus Westeberhardia cardiocondylae]